MAENADSPNYHPLVRKVASAMRKRCKVAPGSTVVVGCSGGADSVALVRALAMLAERRQWGLKLVVAHVHHHLRGEEADEDHAFVGKLAGKLGLGYERRDIKPADKKGNLEANARVLRYRALCEVALKRNARFIATAHHADDQFETLLMRFIRGSSVRGLRGIAWRRRMRTQDPDARVYAIRPMLAAQKDQVLGLLNTFGQDWREDETNSDTTRTRAYLRHNIIPQLKLLRGDAANKAVTLGDHFDQLHQLVQEQADAVPANSTLDELPRDEARRLNPIVLTQVLRRDLINAGVNRDRLPGHALHPVIEAVKDLAGGVRHFDFANNVRIVVGPKTLRVEQRG